MVDALETVRAAEDDLDVLVIDDGSPDGTGEIADQLAAHPAVAARAPPHGARKGSAAPTWTASAGRSRATTTRCSRWTATSRTTRRACRRCATRCAAAPTWRSARATSPGGGVVDWGLARRIISRGGCLYARLLLGLPVHDLTGGFKCFDRRVLEAIALDEVGAEGYAFQIEMTYRANAARLRDRRGADRLQRPRRGGSKMSRRIVAEAAWRVPQLRFRALRGRIPRNAMRKMRLRAVSCSNARTVVDHDRDRRGGGRAAGGYTAYAYETQTDFGKAVPAAGAIVSIAAPTITVKADTSALSDVRVVVDGADLSRALTAAGGALAIEKPEAARRRPHRLVEGHTGGLFGGSRTATWSFTTDTQAPQMTVLVAQQDLDARRRRVRPLRAGRDRPRRVGGRRGRAASCRRRPLPDPPGAPGRRPPDHHRRPRRGRQHDQLAPAPALRRRAARAARARLADAREEDRLAGPRGPGVRQPEAQARDHHQRRGRQADDDADRLPDRDARLAQGMQTIDVRATDRAGNTVAVHEAAAGRLDREAEAEHDAAPRRRRPRRAVADAPAAPRGRVEAQEARAHLRQPRGRRREALPEAERHGPGRHRPSRAARRDAGQDHHRQVEVPAPRLPRRQARADVPDRDRPGGRTRRRPARSSSPRS